LARRVKRQSARREHRDLARTAVQGSRFSLHHTKSRRPQNQTRYLAFRPIVIYSPRPAPRAIRWSGVYGQVNNFRMPRHRPVCSFLEPRLNGSLHVSGTSTVWRQTGKMMRVAGKPYHDGVAHTLILCMRQFETSTTWTTITPCAEPRARRVATRRPGRIHTRQCMRHPRVRWRQGIYELHVSHSRARPGPRGARCIRGRRAVGSERMPLCLSSVTWYGRSPNRAAAIAQALFQSFGGNAASVSESLTFSERGLPRRILSRRNRRTGS